MVDPWEALRSAAAPSALEGPVTTLSTSLLTDEQA
jgi:hypothetical protein